MYHVSCEIDVSNWKVDRVWKDKSSLVGPENVAVQLEIVLNIMKEYDVVKATKRPALVKGKTMSTVLELKHSNVRHSKVFSFSHLSPFTCPLDSCCQMLFFLTLFLINQLV